MSILGDLYVEHATRLVGMTGRPDVQPRVTTRDYMTAMGSVEAMQAAVRSGRVVQDGMFVFLPECRWWTAAEWVAGRPESEAAG